MDKRSYKIKIYIKVKENGNISEFVRNYKNSAEREIYKLNTFIGKQENSQINNQSLQILVKEGNTKTKSEKEEINKEPN